MLDLSIGEPVHGGWCVARQDPADGSAGLAGAGQAGRVIFVRHALPGERVRAVVTQATSRFSRADAVEVRAASPDRVRPPCRHARPGGCGGCDWQHASLPAQREIKARVIRQQLTRLAGLDREVTVEELPGHPDGLGWRTAVGFTIGPDGAAGLLRHRSHEVVEVGSCPIAHPLVAATGVTRQRWPGASRADVAIVPGTGERSVTITGGKVPVSGTLAAGTLLQADSVLSVRPGHRPAALSGRGYLTRQAVGRDWRVSPGTFWQGHPAAADVLAAAVLDALRPQPGDVALDLYCGAGLFAGVLAGAVGPSGRVVAIESSAGAVRDARRNLRATSWVQVHRGDVAAQLGAHGLSGASLAVLDPPRTGLTRRVITALCAPAGLRRIAYVSCDPATLARDIAVFADSGWQLAALRAFDAFPMTHHVECLATLTVIS